MENDNKDNNNNNTCIYHYYITNLVPVNSSLIDNINKCYNVVLNTYVREGAKNTLRGGGFFFWKSFDRPQFWVSLDILCNMIINPPSKKNLQVHLYPLSIFWVTLPIYGIFHLPPPNKKIRVGLHPPGAYARGGAQGHVPPPGLNFSGVSCH